jgi:hypothetical protein
MTDPTSTDELLSRVLDDEATPEERAQVAADGSLQARLELLRRTREQLAAPPPPLDPATVDLLVSRALQEVPEVATAPVPVPAHLAPVTPLRRGLRAHPALAAALTAAAALLLVVLAVPLLSRLGDDGGDETASVADESGSSDAAEGLTAGADVPELGELDDMSSVAAGLGANVFEESAGGGGDGATSDDFADDASEQATEGAGAAPTSTTPPAPAQDQEPEADPDDGTDRAAVIPVPEGGDPVTWCLNQLITTDPSMGGLTIRPATLTWRGEKAVAYLVERPGGDEVLVVSAATCETLAGPEPVDP